MFPNIFGYVGTVNGWLFSAATGAFSTEASDTTHTVQIEDRESSPKGSGFHFYASNYSNVYGSASTVQTASLRALLLIRAY